MKCRDIMECMFDHVFGELTPEVEIQVNEHLAVCEKCRRELNRVEELVAGLRDGTRFKPGPLVYEKIAKELSRVRHHRTRFLGMPRSLVMALGAFLLGIVLTRSVDALVTEARRPVRTEVKQDEPRKVPFSDTVEFYSVPAKNLARI